MRYKTRTIMPTVIFFLCSCLMTQSLCRVVAAHTIKPLISHTPTNAHNLRKISYDP
jgi:hypothetical protein